jgi:hypothetical protein
MVKFGAFFSAAFLAIGTFITFIRDNFPSKSATRPPEITVRHSFLTGAGLIEIPGLDIPFIPAIKIWGQATAQIWGHKFGVRQR